MTTESEVERLKAEVESWIKDRDSWIVRYEAKAAEVERLTAELASLVELLALADCSSTLTDGWECSAGGVDPSLACAVCKMREAVNGQKCQNHYATEAMRCPEIHEYTGPEEYCQPCKERAKREK